MRPGGTHLNSHGGGVARRGLTAGLCALVLVVAFGALPTAAWASSPGPVNTALPVVSDPAGEPPIVGDTLDASTGSWAGSPTSYAYQWYASGTLMPGATSSTYTLTSSNALGASDQNNTFTVKVTATNGQGSTSATSLPSPQVSRSVLGEEHGDVLVAGDGVNEGFSYNARPIPPACINFANPPDDPDPFCSQTPYSDFFAIDSASANGDVTLTDTVPGSTGLEFSYYEPPGNSNSATAYFTSTSHGYQYAGEFFGGQQVGQLGLNVLDCTYGVPCNVNFDLTDVYGQFEGSSYVLISVRTLTANGPGGGGYVYIPLASTTPPAATFTWNGGGANTFNFLSTSTAVPPATITGYSWDFGDGTTSTTGPNVTHTYASEAASRTVTLTVTDSSGAQATSAQVMGAAIEVSDVVSTPPTPPPGQAASLAVTVRNDGPATVTGVVPSVSFTEPTVSPGAPGPAASDLAPGASATFTVPYTPSVTGPVHAQIAASGTTGATQVVATTVTRVITVVGAVTATLTPSTTGPVAGAEFTLDLHVTNSSGDTQDLTLGVPTASPSAGVTVTAPTGSVPPLANGASTDLTYTVTVAQPGVESFTTPVAATDESTSVITNLAPSTSVTAVPVSIVVNSTADDALPAGAVLANVCDVDPDTPGDQCTLRAAIQLANLQSGAQSITFDIPGAGVPTIAPASALPPVNVPVDLDASTQPGGWVELSGAGAGSGAAAGLDVEGGSSTVRGFVVNGWSGDGIYLGGAAGDVVAGDRLGTDVTGTSAVANHVGVEVHATDVTIGGTVGVSAASCSGDCNLISGNGAAYQATGVWVDQGVDVTIIGNTIGTDVTGEQPLGNGCGITINPRSDVPGTVNSGHVVIGGATATPGTGPGNLVSGNGEGIYDTAPSGDTVVGNLIGLDRTGSEAVPVTPALYAESGAAEPGDGVLIMTVPASTGRLMTVGGPSVADENVISGAHNTGVRVLDTNASASVLIEHDEIGTDLTGTHGIGNVRGVYEELYTGTEFPVGTQITVDASVVSGNTSAGIASVWTADRIGTNAAGTAAIPNGDGIIGTVIGGKRPVGDTACDGPCNLISGNLDNGIRSGTDVEGNFIGTDLSGRLSIPNGTDPSPAYWYSTAAVLDSGGSSVDPIGSTVTIGGPSGAVSRGICDQACNLISGNAAAGVTTLGQLSQSVVGNVIGRTIDGGPLGNAGPGVATFSGHVYPSTPAAPVTIGGAGPLGNVIADNGGPAFEDPGLADTDLNGNPIIRDSVAAITGNVVTGNADGIVYPLRGAPAPPETPHVLSAVRSASSVTISGEVIDLASRLAGSAQVDLYGDTSCETGPQGAVPLGSVAVTSILDPSWQLTVPVTAGLTTITATSTIGGQTSPFSSCADITSSGPSPAVADGSYETVSSNGSVSKFSPPGPSSSIVGDSAPVRDSHTVGAHAMATTAPIVGIADTPDGGGSWLVTSAGAVTTSGDAEAFGSEAGVHLAAPIVGVAATPDGGGYWLVASDGGVFAFGDARFLGSMGGTRLVAPVVGITSSPSGHGYLLAASDGGVFAFGDAVFHGSQGGEPLDAPVTGIASAATGGYWLSAADGGVFAFGAPFLGSMGGHPLSAPVVGMSATPDGGGYWLIGSDGGVFSFGDASFAGAAVGSTGGSPVVGISRTYG